jgi:hypothetical protein
MEIASLGYTYSSEYKVGNLEALREIEVPVDDRPRRRQWHKLSDLLTFFRRKIKLRVGEYYRWWNEDTVVVRYFADAIRHNPFVKAPIEQGGYIQCRHSTGFGRRYSQRYSQWVCSYRDVYAGATSVAQSEILHVRFVLYYTRGGSMSDLALNGSASAITCFRLRDYFFADDGLGPNGVVNALLCIVWI